MAAARGADAVTDTASEELARALPEATCGQRAAGVVDPVREPHFDAARRCLACQGRLVVLGFAGGAVPSLGLNRPRRGNCSILGRYRGDFVRRRPDLLPELKRQLLALYQRGAIRPRLRGQLAFEELPRGY
ncbi:MAG: zinc-binding dehydrogenase [Candidatus Dormibacteria bacterium]